MATRLQMIARQILSSPPIPSNHQLVDMEVSEDGKIGCVYLKRESDLNALSDELILAMNAALLHLEEDEKIVCVILSGRGKAFAAGADIKELEPYTTSKFLLKDKIAPWEKVLPIMRKPVIAAINGFALGGGCEIAMMCDIIIAAKSARFGQPEIKLGLIPGAGGTQRLTRQIGKSNSMLLCMTGDTISAQEAKEMSLVSIVTEDNEVMKKAIDIATKISSNSPIVLKNIKEAVSFNLCKSHILSINALHLFPFTYIFITPYESHLLNT